MVIFTIRCEIYSSKSVFGTNTHSLFTPPGLSLLESVICLLSRKIICSEHQVISRKINRINKMSRNDKILWKIFKISIPYCYEKDYHLQLQWKMLTAEEKLVMWLLSRQSSGRHQLTRKKESLSKLFLIFQVPPWKTSIICLQRKKYPGMWLLSRQLLSRHQLNKKKELKKKISFSSPSLKLESTTVALATAKKVAYSASKIRDVAT